MSETPSHSPQKPSSIMGRPSAETKFRAFIVFAVCTALTLVVVGRLLYLQIIRHDYYKKLVLEQMLYETEITAARGMITDRNGVTLAANVTTERVFVDPANIAKADDPVKVREMISELLSEILEVEYDFVYTETGISKYRDRTIKKNVDKEITDKIRAFMVENEDLVLSEEDDDLDLYQMIYFAENTTRVYPSEHLLLTSSASVAMTAVFTVWNINITMLFRARRVRSWLPKTVNTVRCLIIMKRISMRKTVHISLRPLIIKSKAISKNIWKKRLWNQGQNPVPAVSS